MARSREGIQYVEHVEGDGGEMYDAACKVGLEGIVSKRLTAPYESGPKAGSGPPSAPLAKPAKSPLQHCAHRLANCLAPLLHISSAVSSFAAIVFQVFYLKFLRGPQACRPGIFVLVPMHEGRSFIDLQYPRFQQPETTLSR